MHRIGIHCNVLLKLQDFRKSALRLAYKFDNAETLLEKLKDSDSYIEVNGDKVLMYEICSQEINKAKDLFKSN